ncbi:hypothetical protein [Acidovorax sp. FG27]|uniref:hypothetical protein n=1 Tax=Acidovorax sp. FG27 TaxID=3133652 RepID=UPI003341AF3A
MTSNLEHPNARMWMAAGVQHAVLMRALPAMRHDLASPLSVLRMGMTVLKRRVAPGNDTPAEQAVERVEQLEGQLTTLGEHVRRLRNWDVQITDRQPARATLLEAIELARPLLALRGVFIQPLAGALPGDSEAPVAHHTLLYITLAAIYHLGESPSEPPAEIHIEPREGGIRVTARGSVSPDALPPLVPASAQNTLPIDADALQCLADHLRVPITRGARQVDIALGAG